MADDRTFFEIAAAVLPALMLAGLLSDRLKPPARPSREPGWPYWAILIGGAYFVLAETVAIRAAIAGDPTGFDRVVVSVALIGAAVGTVLLVLLPWLESVPRASRKRHLIPLGMLLLVLVVGSVVVLDRAVETATLVEEAEEQEEEGRRLLAELQTALARDARVKRERTNLILRKAALLGRRPPPRDLKGRLFVINTQLELTETRLDEYAYDMRRLTNEFRDLYFGG